MLKRILGNPNPLSNCHLRVPPVSGRSLKSYGACDWCDMVLSGMVVTHGCRAAERRHAESCRHVGPFIPLKWQNSSSQQPNTCQARLLHQERYIADMFRSMTILEERIGGRAIFSMNRWPGCGLVPVSGVEAKLRQPASPTNCPQPGSSGRCARTRSRAR